MPSIKTKLLSECCEKIEKIDWESLYDKYHNCKSWDANEIVELILLILYREELSGNQKYIPRLNAMWQFYNDEDNHKTILPIQIIFALQYLQEVALSFNHRSPTSDFRSGLYM